MSSEELDSRMARVEEQTAANGRDIDTIKSDIAEIRNDQKAIYDLGSSVKLLVERMQHMAEKLDDTNADVKTLNKEMSGVKTQLAEVDVKADKQVAKNWNQIKVAIVTAICTLLVTGAIGALLTFAK